MRNGKCCDVHNKGLYGQLCQLAIQVLNREEQRVFHVFALVPSYSAPTQFLWLWVYEAIFPRGRG